MGPALSRHSALVEAWGVGDMELNSGNIAWMLTASALVLFMTPGLGFFYGGLTRNKNVLATIMQSFITTGVVAIVWILVGYSLAFGPDSGLGLIGNFDWIGLKDVAAAPGGPNGAVYGIGIPHLLFMAFQLMFAIITPALITGAFAERAKFGPFLIFTALWSLLVYVPVAHWVFAYDGWLSAFSTNANAPDIGLNTLDFAGGLAIHVNAGFAAIAAVLVFGKRKGFGKEPMEPHDITMCVLGAAILWFGWFGFNPGSTLNATNLHFADVVVTTQMAAAGGALAALIAVYVKTRTLDVGMIGNGAIAALVAITAPSGYVEPWAAIVIGAVAGLIVVFGVYAIDRYLDDPIGALPAHGMAGIWGTLSCGLFTVPALATFNGTGQGGLFYTGSFSQLGAQAVAVGASFVTVFVLSFAVFWVIKKTVGLRVTAHEELEGLDISEHGMWGYPEAFMPVPGGVYRPAEFPTVNPHEGAPERVKLGHKEVTV